MVTSWHTGPNAPLRRRLYRISATSKPTSKLSRTDALVSLGQSGDRRKKRRKSPCQRRSGASSTNPLYPKSGVMFATRMTIQLPTISWSTAPTAPSACTSHATASVQTLWMGGFVMSVKRDRALSHHANCVICLAVHSKSAPRRRHGVIWHVYCGCQRRASRRNPVWPASSARSVLSSVAKPFDANSATGRKELPSAVATRHVRVQRTRCVLAGEGHGRWT